MVKNCLKEKIDVTSVISATGAVNTERETERDRDLYIYREREATSALRWQ